MNSSNGSKSKWLATLTLLLVCALSVLITPRAEAADGVSILQVGGRYHAVFTPSSDHDAVEHQAPVLTRYELTILPASGPAIVLDLGKPTPVNNEIAVDIEDTIRPLAAGAYNATLTAIGPNGAGGSSLASFTLAPRVPGAPGSLQIIIRTTTVAETTIDRATGAIVGTVANTRTEVIDR